MKKKQTASKKVDRPYRLLIQNEGPFDWSHPDVARAHFPLETVLTYGLFKELFRWQAIWWERKTAHGHSALKKLTINTPLKKDDRLVIYYDPSKKMEAPEMISVFDQKSFGVWFKPAGVLSQGTLYGNFFTAIAQIQRKQKLKKEPHLIHRLDRETSGLMLVAYNPKAAKTLTELLMAHKIKKIYYAKVKGQIEAKYGSSGRFEDSLEGQKARTDFYVIKYEAETDTSYLEIHLETGRLHQIRKHLSMHGFPVWGDPLYGRQNKNKEGLQLQAVRLEWVDPFSRRKIDIWVPDQNRIF